MALSSEDVQRIAHLARLEITPSEAAEVKDKLDRILDLIGKMRAVDTTGIVPMSHAQDVSAPLREDAVTESDRHVDYQRVAPPGGVAHDLYLVPKVIE
jgi:aspartyl-tRNA(Asn)/glutamyl-tRNA(Gln) amidotransferase subunit C